MNMELNLESYRINGLALWPDFETGGPSFAATDQTLLVTHDGGQTWQDALQEVRAGQPVPVLSVLCTAHALKSRLVLAGVSGGLLRSEDGGGAWQMFTLASPPPLVTALAESPSGDLFAGTAQDGVFLSKNDGLSWARWNFGLLDGNVFTLLAVQWNNGNKVVFTGTQTGIFSSVNSGRTWREVDFPMEAAPVLSLCALPQAGPDQLGLLFAGTETEGLFRSSDLGRTWELVGQGVFSAEISALVAYAGGLYVASGDWVWISPDGGDTWRRWDPPAPVIGGFLCLAMSRENCMLAGTSGGQIFRIS